MLKAKAVKTYKRNLTVATMRTAQGVQLNEALQLSDITVGTAVAVQQIEYRIMPTETSLLIAQDAADSRLAKDFEGLVTTVQDPYIHVRPFECMPHGGIHVVHLGALALFDFKHSIVPGELPQRGNVSRLILSRVFAID